MRARRILGINIIKRVKIAILKVKVKGVWVCHAWAWEVQYHICPPHIRIRASQVQISAHEINYC